MKTVTCSFLNQQETSNNSCSIKYGLPGETCRILSHQNGNSSSSDGVQVVLPMNDLLQPQREYCFIVTASNGTFIAMVEGLFTIGIHMYGELKVYKINHIIDRFKGFQHCK